MISVVIPCFNSEESIRRAVDSVLNQTYKNFEIIVVDNGSTDNTVKILEDYKKKYPVGFRLLKEVKKGAPLARNKGLSEANGEWIQFLDSDDELLPNKLEEQVKIANTSPCDLVVGSCWIHKPDNPLPEFHLVESASVWKGLIISKLGRTSSILWRKEVLLKVGGWDGTKTSSQEYNLLFQLLQQGARVAFNKEPLTRIYVRENSVHKSTNKERTAEVVDNNIKLRLDVKEYLKASNKLTDQLNQTINIYIHAFLMTFKRHVPEYVEQKLKVLKLDLPIAYFIKRRLRRAGHQLKYYKKQVVDLFAKSA